MSTELYENEEVDSSEESDFESCWFPTLPICAGQVDSSETSETSETSESVSDVSDVSDVSEFSF